MPPLVALGRSAGRPPQSVVLLGVRPPEHRLSHGRAGTARRVDPSRGGRGRADRDPARRAGLPGAAGWPARSWPSPGCSTRSRRSRCSRCWAVPGPAFSTVLIGLVLYALLAIVRNALTGLRQVPAEVREAAQGMGYGRLGLLWRVELPLALPGILTGLRSRQCPRWPWSRWRVVGFGGFGNMILTGFNTNFYKPQIMTGTLGCLGLALIFDLVAGRRSAGWRCRGPAGGRRDHEHWRQAFVWLNDPLNWTNPDGILARTAEHLQISAVGGAAWPASWRGRWASGSGHLGAAASLIVAVANLTRAVPTVALLTIFPLTVIGFGYPPIVLALAIFALPPLLANAYLGVREVDPEVRDAARGMGMSGPADDVPGRAAAGGAVPGQRVPDGGGAGGGDGDPGRVRQRRRARHDHQPGLRARHRAGGDQVIAGGLVVIVLCLALDGAAGARRAPVTPRHLRRRRRAACASAADRHFRHDSADRRGRNQTPRWRCNQTCNGCRELSGCEHRTARLSGGAGWVSCPSDTRPTALALREGRAGTRKAGRRDVCAYTSSHHDHTRGRTARHGVRPRRLRRERLLGHRRPRRPAASRRRAAPRSRATQLVLLTDDKNLQNSDNIIAVANARRGHAGAARPPWTRWPPRSTSPSCWR